MNASSVGHMLSLNNVSTTYRTQEQDCLDRGGCSGRRSATGNRLATLVVASGKFFPILSNPTNDVLHLTLDTLCSI